MKVISIILPVFNALDFTKKCIRNLNETILAANSSEFKVNIIIIDDGSKDGTSDWVLSQKKENLFLIKGDGNLWWSGGVNAGVKYAIDNLKTDYVLLWNNDVIASSNYFTELFKILNQLPNSSQIIGSKIFTDSHLQTIWSMGGFFNPYSGKKYMWGFKKTDTGQFEKPLKVDWLPGMGSVIPVNVIQKIGLWDAKSFPQYHGDSDFTYRAKLENFDIVVYPSLKIWNDTTNTGIKHNLSFKRLYRQLFDIKSNYNISKNLLFYKKYSKSILAYYPLFKAYSILFGGFLKWKMLQMFNIQKKV